MQQPVKEEAASLRDLLLPRYRRVMLVGVVLAILVQISGINTVIDYAPIILRSAGNTIGVALFQTFIMGFLNFAPHLRRDFHRGPRRSSPALHRRSDRNDGLPHAAERGISSGQGSGTRRANSNSAVHRFVCRVYRSGLLDSDVRDFPQPHSRIGHVGRRLHQLARQFPGRALFSRGCSKTPAAAPRSASSP